MSARTLQLLEQDAVPKGDPRPVAKVAAIQAAKNTTQLIPYCHPLPIDFVGVTFEVCEQTLVITVLVKAIYKTGVEMEALAAASAAALTVYDMLKMVDDDLTMGPVVLLSKTGGKSGAHVSAAARIAPAVLVISDSVSAGQKEDRSGRYIVGALQEHGASDIVYEVVSDNVEHVKGAIVSLVDERHCDLVITTGGTGFGPRDHVPEVMSTITDRSAPGIAEAIRQYGQQRTATAMLSRAQAGLRGRSLIVNLPGSLGAATDGMSVLLPAIFHSLDMMHGKGHGPAASLKAEL